MLLRVVKLCLFSLYGIAVAWILLFLAIEIRPILLNQISLDFIPYYAVKRASLDYTSDPDLVLSYRKSNFVFQTEFTGDMFKPEYGGKPETLPYIATYENGFRKNSSTFPYDLAVIGDSYVEIGENDLLTFSEMLKQSTGFSVANFGRGWYGPPQYLEVFKRYVLPMKPRYVLFCFFAGNDMDDMRQYKRWKTEGRFYFYRNLDDRYLISRFGIATKETILRLGGIARTTIKQLPSLLKSESEMERPELGLIEVEGELRLKAFNYWERKITEEEVESLRAVLAEFKQLSDENQVLPIVVYIPTSSQVYADSYSEKSNSKFRKRMESLPGNPSMDTVLKLGQELEIDVINLLPVFKSEALKGRLSYYTFDTHWNVQGRRIAADVVGTFLQERFHPRSPN